MSANPRALPKESVVMALKSCGSRTISLEQLEKDIEAGAPMNDNGTIDIIAYGAWLVKGVLNGD